MFYHSKAWKTVKNIIWLKQHCLCARCGYPVYVDGITTYKDDKRNRRKGIVHHKIYLTDDNYLDESISLNEDYLEGLCIKCHNTEHFKNEILRDDLKFDQFGNLVKK